MDYLNTSKFGYLSGEENIRLRSDCLIAARGRDGFHKDEEYIHFIEFRTWGTTVKSTYLTYLNKIRVTKNESKLQIGDITDNTENTTNTTNTTNTENTENTEDPGNI